MGEVEFFNEIKRINRLLSNDNRIEIWNFIMKQQEDTLRYNTSFKRFEEIKKIRTEEEILYDIELRKIIKEEGL